MKLSELTMDEWIDKLASVEPASGGGSVAALVGAAGAALAAMAAALTRGDGAGGAQAAFAAHAERESGQLCQRLMDMMNRDAEALRAVSAAYSLPRGSASSGRNRAGGFRLNLSVPAH